MSERMGGQGDVEICGGKKENYLWGGDWRKSDTYLSAREQLNAIFFFLCVCVCRGFASSYWWTPETFGADQQERGGVQNMRSGSQSLLGKGYECLKGVFEHPL